MIVVLDSTVLIDYLRGRSAVDYVEALLRRGDTAATTGINVDEVVRGLRGPELDPARGLFQGLLVLPIGADEGWRAGTWRREFAARGVSLAQADCLIAAATVSAGARLATANLRDFPMPELDVDQWPPR